MKNQIIMVSTYLRINKLDIRDIFNEVMMKCQIKALGVQFTTSYVVLAFCRPVAQHSAVHSDLNIMENFICREQISMISPSRWLTAPSYVQTVNHQLSVLFM